MVSRSRGTVIDSVETGAFLLAPWWQWAPQNSVVCTVSQINESNGLDISQNVSTDMMDKMLPNIKIACIGHLVSPLTKTTEVLNLGFWRYENLMQEAWTTPVSFDHGGIILLCWTASLHEQINALVWVMHVGSCEALRRENITRFWNLFQPCSNPCSLPQIRQSAQITYVS